jgi:hypothetical protein
MHPRRPATSNRLLLAQLAAIVVFVAIGHYGFEPFRPRPAAVEPQVSQALIQTFHDVARQAGPDADLSKVSPELRTKFDALLGSPPMSHEVILRNWMKTHPGPY